MFCKNSDFRFSVISTKVRRITPKIFLTFNFNPFATLMQNFTFVPSVSPNLLNLNQDHPSKKRFFWSNPYKIEVMITSLTEMLEFPNFGHMTTSAMNLNHDIKICWRRHEQKLWHHNIYFKILYFKTVRGSHLCWHYENCNHVY